MKITGAVADLSVGEIATFVLNLSRTRCDQGHAVIAQQPGGFMGAMWEKHVEELDESNNHYSHAG